MLTDIFSPWFLHNSCCQFSFHLFSSTGWPWTGLRHLDRIEFLLSLFKLINIRSCQEVHGENLSQCRDSIRKMVNRLVLSYQWGWPKSRIVRWRYSKVCYAIWSYWYIMPLKIENWITEYYLIILETTWTSPKFANLITRQTVNLILTQDLFNAEKIKQTQSTSPIPHCEREDLSTVPFIKYCNFCFQLRSWRDLHSKVFLVSDLAVCQFLGNFAI